MRGISKIKADPRTRVESRKWLAALQSAKKVIGTIGRRPADTPIEVNERQLQGKEHAFGTPAARCRNSADREATLESPESTRSCHRGRMRPLANCSCPRSGAKCSRAHQIRARARRQPDSRSPRGRISTPRSIIWTAQRPIDRGDAPWTRRGDGSSATLPELGPRGERDGSRNGRPLGKVGLTPPC